ncbi:MAG: PAS domain S-box protein [Halobacteriaceae archaeon]
MDASDRRETGPSSPVDHDILREIPVGVFRTTVTGRFVDANSAMEAMLGASSFEALSDRRVREFYVDETDRDEFVDRIESTGVVREYELPLRTLDGDSFWGSVTAMRHERADGTDYIDGVVQDVTERKRAQETVRERERLLTQLTEHTPDVLWMFDADWEETLFVNPAYEKVWGADVETLEADPESMFDRIHPEDRERVAAAMATLSAGEEADVEFRVNPEADYRWVWAAGQPVVDDEGEVSRVVGFTRDVTERKRREEALERSQERYESLLETAPDAIVAADAETGEIVEVNERATDLFGRERSALLGAHQSTLHPADEAERYRALFARHVGEGESAVSRFEDGDWVYATRGDGERVPVEINARVTDVGDRRLTFGIFRDVSERKARTEQLDAYRRELEETVADLERSNEELEQFAYVASHDLQEPLRMISSYLDLLETEYSEDLDAEAIEYIDFAVDGAHRMQRLIDDLLTFSRVESRGRDPVETDAERILEEVVADLAMRIEETDAEVTAEELGTVRADPDQLRQLLQNLIANAIDYAGDGPPRIHVSVTEEADRHVVAVEDEGVGVPADQQERIFEVFTRGERNDDDEGTGIGLAICKRIVAGHGGEMWIESTEGEGSTFFFSLPKQGRRDT